MARALKVRGSQAVDAVSREYPRTTECTARIHGLQPATIFAEIKRKIAGLRLTPWEADDIVQDVLLRILEVPNGKELHEPLAFIKRAAWNACLTRIRDSRNDRKKLALFAESLPQAVTHGPDESLFLKEVLEHVRDSQLRAILTLVLLSGASLEEMRRAMGLARTPARRLVQHLKLLLQDLLSDQKPAWIPFRPGTARLPPMPPAFVPAEPEVFLPPPAREFHALCPLCPRCEDSSNFTLR
jgi:DNA-directed RNA polymerase specialized sigma24 family protein